MPEAVSSVPEVEDVTDDEYEVGRRLNTALDSILNRTAQDCQHAVVPFIGQRHRSLSACSPLTRVSARARTGVDQPHWPSPDLHAGLYECRRPAAGSDNPAAWGYAQGL
jgi:hypothetical protein